MKTTIYSVQQIKYDLLAQIREFGSAFDEWYVGTTADPGATLFTEHGVHPDDDVWVFRQALTARAAATAQRYFVEQLHTDGTVPPATDVDADCVFAFRKSARTRPVARVKEMV